MVSCCKLRVTGEETGTAYFKAQYQRLLSDKLLYVRKYIIIKIVTICDSLYEISF
jgi:hypothetical protein